MSRAAPLVESHQRIILTAALKLVNDPSKGTKHPDATARFVVVKDEDPNGTLSLTTKYPHRIIDNANASCVDSGAMGGSYFGLEAKNILIAAMIGNKWDTLLKSKYTTIS